MGKIYQAHRLAWLYVYGKFPDNFIDHINGITDDNRLCNLREATYYQNSINTKIRKTNTIGYRGVSYIKKLNKYRARICVNKKQIHIGLYSTALEALEAYNIQAKIHFGNFIRV